VARIPPAFLASLRDMQSPFTPEQVEKKHPRLNPASISVYLSHASRAGLIERIGPRVFRTVEPKDTGRPLSGLVAKVVKRLRGVILPSAMEQLVVWSDEDLALFVHDAIMQPFVVIEGPTRTLHTIHDVLASEFKTDLVHNRHLLGQRLWKSHQAPDSMVFLVSGGRLHGTRPSAHGFQIPKVGRLLVNALQVPALLPDTALRLMQAPEFDVRDAVEAAPSKQAAAQLGAFLAWTLLRHPGHPALEKAERLLPSDMEMW